jgi:hypothetical protein
LGRGNWLDADALWWLTVMGRLSRVGRFRRQTRNHTSSRPGVDSAAATEISSLSAGGHREQGLGHDPSRKLPSNFSTVSAGYFRTIGTELLAGRGFDERDTTTSPAVAIINESLASRLRLGPNPVGKHAGEKRRRQSRKSSSRSSASSEIRNTTACATSSRQLYSAPRHRIPSPVDPRN